MAWGRVSQLRGMEQSNHLIQRGFGIRYTAGPQWYSMLFVASIESQGSSVLDKDGNPLLTSAAAANAMHIFVLHSTSGNIA